MPGGRGVREVIRGRSCCGCGVCAAVCPSDAITIVYNPTCGYRVAVDDAKCTECGLCDAVCPKVGPGIDATTGPTESFLLGDTRLCVAAIASDSDIRQQGASGGVVTATAIEALESGMVDMLLCPTFRAAELRMEHRIMTDADQLLASQGSNYLPGTMFPAIKDALEREGKIGVVGLPCQVRAIQNARASLPRWSDRIVLTLGLFCNSQPSEQLSRFFLERMRVNKQDIATLRYRIGHWRGRLHLVRKDGTVREWPFQEFSRYWTFFRSPGCYSCADLTSELADVSFGDIWHPSWEAVPEKHTGVLVRTDRGEEVWNAARQAGRIRERPLSTTELVEGQRVALPWKKRAFGARAVLWKRLGWTFQVGTTLKPRAGDYASACLDWLSYRIGRSRIARWVLARCSVKIVAFYARLANIHAVSRIRTSEQ